MKIRESAENYLETILMLQNKNGKVRSIDIVEELGFAKPSVSVAMKQLRENGYISVNDSGYITLTQIGLEVAQNVYERHTVIAQMLISIGVNSEVAYEDACRIEHHISEESFRCMKQHFHKEHR